MWIRPDEHKIVGSVLAEARQRADLTQVELAKLLAKPQSFVSSYEAGQRRLDLLELIRIADVLKADPVALATEIIGVAKGQGIQRNSG